MYLPLLRGKLYEFKAIKEFIAENMNASRFVMPIIEPVKKDMSPMLSCVDEMRVAGMKFATILNPTLGDYKRDSFDIEGFIHCKQVKGADFVPAFQVNGQNIISIRNYIAEYSMHNVMLIFFSGLDYDNLDTQSLLSMPEVDYVVVMNLSSNRAMQRRLKGIDKRIVTMEDRFVEQYSNDDYRSNIDEFFTDTFSYYNDDGLFGFSDYTSLARNYKEGGVLPNVVAIHLTYQKNNEEVNVHHFLSVTKNGKDNIRGEFKEASNKIAPFFADKPKTNAINQLIETDFPGLGAIKKLSIKNHLELMSSILTTQAADE